MSTPAPSKALLAEVAGGAPKLAHVQPKESASLTQAKVLKGVTGKHELTHVEAPKSGLTDAQKEAFKNKEKDEQ